MPTHSLSPALTNDVFRIFFLCEDAQALDRATALKDRLAENCRDQVEVDAEFCEYARLCHPRLRENATQHAGAADMIVISARGTDGLPAFVQTWMNQLGAHTAGKVICAEYLQTESPEQASGFHGFMDQWAAQSGIPLFSNLFPGNQELEAVAA